MRILDLLLLRDCSSHLALMLQERRPADEKELPIDLAAIATNLNPGDMQAAWQKGLSDEVAHASRQQLRLLQRGGGTESSKFCNTNSAPTPEGRSDDRLWGLLFIGLSVMGGKVWLRKGLGRWRMIKAFSFA